MSVLQRLKAFFTGQQECHAVPDNNKTDQDIDNSTSEKKYSIREQLEALGENHEVECIYDPAAMRNRVLNCQKNPGHKKFIPIYKFGLRHLPSGCRDRQVFWYFKQMSKFTVKLEVRYTSPGRPVYYPCARLGKKQILRVASGTAWISTETSEFPCPIADCPYNKEEHKVHGYIRILTSKHVVFDKEEALKTNIQFFYDRQNQMGPKFFAQCVELEYSFHDNDVAYLKCITHNLHLCSILERYKDAVMNVYRGIPTDVWRACDDLCVIIGHPHGMAKMISVGRHVRFEETLSRSHIHYHTAPTCPGSSGAPMYYVCLRETGCMHGWIPAVHSFHCLLTKMNCAYK